MSDVNPAEAQSADAIPPRPPLPTPAPAQVVAPRPTPREHPPYPAAPYPPYAPGQQTLQPQPVFPEPAYAPSPTSAAVTAPVAPYRPPQQPQYGAALEAPAPAGAPTLGIVALILAVIALIGAPLVATISSSVIAHSVGEQIITVAGGLNGSDAFWTVLSPVRDQVLVAELSFWIGTALGVWAIVQGIIAAVKRRGRGWGVAAIVVAAIAPFAYGLLVWLTLWISLFSGVATSIPNQL